MYKEAGLSIIRAEKPSKMNEYCDFWEKVT